jgi:hypothetical protein
MRCRPAPTSGRTRLRIWTAARHQPSDPSGAVEDAAAEPGGRNVEAAGRLTRASTARKSPPWWGARTRATAGRLRTRQGRIRRPTASFTFTLRATCSGMPYLMAARRSRFNGRNAEIWPEAVRSIDHQVADPHAVQPFASDPDVDRERTQVTDDRRLARQDPAYRSFRAKGLRTNCQSNRLRNRSAFPRRRCVRRVQTVRRGVGR